MNDLLKTIVAAKKQEVEECKRSRPIAYMEPGTLSRKNVSMKSALLSGGSGIIAEIKRRSPSKGYINSDINIHDLSKGYVKAGAAAISVLTDHTFFGGSHDDLLIARASVSCPILRKDFIIDEYQVFETKHLGADVILLIASILTKNEILQFSLKAKSLGMEVLLEIHTEKEIDKINDAVDLVGVNNRNLNDLSISIDRSLQLSPLIPKQFLKISESGINTPEKLIELRQAGFRGFLIGESFMSSQSPEKACADFIQSVNNTIKITTDEN